MEDLGMQSQCRRHAFIPIFIVEYHDEVLPFIYRNIGAKYLPFQNGTLIHFDAHPDLGIPADLEADVVRTDKEALFRTLSIENWIIPACYGGHFSKVVWIKPKWAHQMTDGYVRLHVGRNQNGKVRVDSTLPYFLSECLSCPLDQLSNVQSVDLHVHTMEAAPTSYDVVSDGESDFVLDIDLDFFSTSNPFLNMHEKCTNPTVYERLRKLYHFNYSSYATPLEALDNRKKQMDDLFRIFECLYTTRQMPLRCQNTNLSAWNQINALKEDLEVHYPSSSIDWLLIHDAGCTVDETDLPHHICSEAELEQMFTQFQKMISTFGKPPNVITISRSCDDDYTPLKYVERIQERVLSILQEAFQCGEIIKHYLDES